MIELIIVVAIVAISAAVASLSLRDGAQSQLDREAARLAALLEGARAEARASGVSVRWEPARDGEEVPWDFRFVGLAAAQGLPTKWLGLGVRAEVVGAKALRLGPEPLIGAQQVVLQLDDRRATLSTDGLGPFVVAEETP